MNVATPKAEAQAILQSLGVTLADSGLPSNSPIDGELIGNAPSTTAEQAQTIIAEAHQAFLEWRQVPPPIRGELVRLLGEEIRREKAALGRLVTLEAGKITSEGEGEVQEMIDICIFAAGLSRQLHGLTIATERRRHRMMETWHPLGVTGVISAFNFPVAVWAWNAALALVCGNSVVWKPSEKTPLCALAVQALIRRAMARFGEQAPSHLCALLAGNSGLGQTLVNHPQVAMVSATGSTAMGRQVAPRLAGRFARAILELGGNNAAIVCPTADLALTLRAIAFSAMGTAGQRCTTLRRLFVHDSIYERLLGQLESVYQSVTVGDPRDSATLVGPLIDERSYRAMEQSLAEAKAVGARIFGGERVSLPSFPKGVYVRPALVEMSEQKAVMRQETFAPILYVLRYRDLQEAIALQNDVPQGLSSSIFTNDLREAELFLSTEGSDCGIANVNIGPSGAEIGGAFGGEKETGGGRESGSDVWKLYMRRATNTVNFGSELPLAQGVTFNVG